jgi:hypothetical protein
MDDSILSSIKDAASVNVDDNVYDQELILHINSTFTVLRQLGVGPTTAFYIEDSNAKWSDFTTDDNILPMIKSYVTLKVRSLFDPPTSSSLAEAINSQIAEYEWRLGIECDNYKVEEDAKYADRT